MKQMLTMCRMGLLGSAILWAGCSTAPKAPESEAHQVLRRMSEVLAGSQSFSFEVTASMDQPNGEGQTVRLSRYSKILVARPDRIFASVVGDDGERAMWYQGSKLTILEKGHNEYATITVPRTIDKMLDYAMEEHGLSLPLADLLFANPYAVLTERVETGEHLGRDFVGGLDTEHLLFTQENVDWEIWIDAGDVPLVRKIVITQKREPGSPQFVAVLGKWNLSASPAPDAFEFRPPKGATKVEMSDLIGNE